MLNSKIQKLLDEFNNSPIAKYYEKYGDKKASQYVEQGFRARISGRNHVSSGHLKKISSKGGSTVTFTKLNKILKLNKSKRLLVDEQVIEMKHIYRSDISIGFPELAQKYNVDKVTIHNIMHGKIYIGIGGDVEIRIPKATCPHCRMVAVKGNITRFHGDKCKKLNQ